MPTIRQHDNRSPPQRTAEGSLSSSHNVNNALDRNPPTMSEVCDTPITDNHGGTNSATQLIDTIRWWRRPSVCGRNRRDQYRETNDKTKPFIHTIHDDFKISFMTMTILTFTFRFLPSPLFSLFVASFFSYFAGLLVGFILVGIAFYRTLLGLNERKGRWVVQQDFHGKFQSNVTSVFSFLSVVLDWIVLILVWFERSLHSLTIKTDDVTIGRRDEDSCRGRGGTSDFKWQGWSNGANNKTQKNSMWILNLKNLQKEKTHLVVLKSQNYAAGIRGHYHVLNSQRNPYLNQATQKNTCQILLPKKIPESKISKLVPDTWNPEYTPWGIRTGGFGRFRGLEQRWIHRGKPVLVSRLSKSFLPMSKSACFSCWMVRFGCVVSRYSKSRMVGLKSAYCSKRLITFTSTFSSLEKCFQLRISLISLSRNSAIFSIRSGFFVKTSDNKNPLKNKKCSCDQ